MKTNDTIVEIRTGRKFTILRWDLPPVSLTALSQGCKPEKTWTIALVDHPSATIEVRDSVLRAEYIKPKTKGHGTKVQWG